MDNNDLRFLKRHYGEKFAHLCRELFPTILEEEGLLSKIISDHFAPTKSLYDDVVSIKKEFKEFIYGCVKLDKAIASEIAKTPEELMDEAGYILYPECKSEEDIQSFKKYWAKGEELCTFRGGRLDSCRVWFAVKKNADEIKRKNFNNPSRQDEYGTSVISIQFSRGSGSTLSIKNRYNHTVLSPDATFGNNLDNIIPGLTQSFIKTYGIDLLNNGRESIYIPDYRRGNDGRYYRVNVENFDVCYCENNVMLIDGRKLVLDKARYILAEDYIIDKQAKTIRAAYAEVSNSFPKSIGEIKDIEVKTDEKGNRVIICTPKEGDDVEITLNAQNSIIGYKNPNVTEVEDGFLEDNIALQNLDMTNLQHIKKEFLRSNRGLTSISLPNLKSIDDDFLWANRKLSKINLPKLEQVGDYFLEGNWDLKELSLPSLVKAGENFLPTNHNIKKLNLPNLTEVGNYFMLNNHILNEIYVPKLRKAGDFFLAHNEGLCELNLPNLTELGEASLGINKTLKTFNAPKLKKYPELLKVLRTNNEQGIEDEKE